MRASPWLLPQSARGCRGCGDRLSWRAGRVWTLYFRLPARRTLFAPMQTDAQVQLSALSNQPSAENSRGERCVGGAVSARSDSIARRLASAALARDKPPLALSPPSQRHPPPHRRKTSSSRSKMSSFGWCSLRLDSRGGEGHRHGGTECRLEGVGILMRLKRGCASLHAGAWFRRLTFGHSCPMLPR